MSTDAKTSMPVEGNNPMNFLFIAGMQVAFTGVMAGVVKHTPVLRVLDDALPFSTPNIAMCWIIMLAGLIQGWLGATTNWARKEYNVPWPWTFAQPSNKNKLKFDMVQRAHLNFVENYTQVLGVSYFAAQVSSNLAAVCGSFFLLGRLAFIRGYYTGNAKNKDSGAFGYILGFFPLVGLAWYYLISNLLL